MKGKVCVIVVMAHAARITVITRIVLLAPPLP
jgi:hypothetical protein